MTVPLCTRSGSCCNGTPSTRGQVPAPLVWSGPRHHYGRTHYLGTYGSPESKAQHDKLAPLAGWRERKGQGPRPDVFSLDFKAHIEKKINAVCHRHKNSGNLLGYLYCDVPSWILGRGEQRKRGNTTMIYPWVSMGDRDS